VQIYVYTYSCIHIYIYMRICMFLNICPVSRPKQRGARGGAQSISRVVKIFCKRALSFGSFAKRDLQLKEKGAVDFKSGKDFLIHKNVCLLHCLVKTVLGHCHGSIMGWLWLVGSIKL